MKRAGWLFLFAVAFGVRAERSEQPPGRAVPAWNHGGVTLACGSFPERPATRLTRLAEAGEPRTPPAGGDAARVPPPRPPAPSTTEPVLGSQAWREAVDFRTGLRDGGGPAIGTDDWLRAVSRRLGVSDDQGHGPSPGSGEWLYAVHRKAFGTVPVTTVEVAYMSADEELWRVTYDLLQQSATVNTPDGVITLHQTVSASGARYRDDKGNLLWNKGSSVTFLQGERVRFQGDEVVTDVKPQADDE